MSISTMHEKNSPDFGFNPSRLKTARLAKGLSQEQLGSKIGVTRGAMASWEQGKFDPQRDKIILLSQALDVYPNYFFEWEEVTATTALSSPLDSDIALRDRDLRELQGAAGGALRSARNRLCLDVSQVATMSGIPASRLSQIESRLGEPISTREIHSLREALGVEFDPRAVAFSDSDNDKPSLEESRREYLQEWVVGDHTDKMNLILSVLERMEKRLNAIEKKGA